MPLENFSSNNALGSDTDGFTFFKDCTCDRCIAYRKDTEAKKPPYGNGWTGMGYFMPQKLTLDVIDHQELEKLRNAAKREKELDTEVNRLQTALNAVTVSRDEWRTAWFDKHNKYVVIQDELNKAITKITELEKEVDNLTDELDDALIRGDNSESDLTNEQEVSARRLDYLNAVLKDLNSLDCSVHNLDSISCAMLRSNVAAIRYWLYRCIELDKSLVALNDE